MFRPRAPIGNCDRCPGFDCVRATHLLVDEFNRITGLCDKHADEVRAEASYARSMSRAEDYCDRDEVRLVSEALAKAERIREEL